MTRSISPLRYPGGKASLYPLFVSILRENDLLERRYIEPYSGGCGLGLSLLMNGLMSRLHINDIDRSIWAFWYLLINHTEELVRRIETCPLTIDEWHRQREIQKSKESACPIDLGFSTFYLNRTNRSGVIHSGGVIGGLEQKGSYKMDCRFHRNELARRAIRIGKYKGRIELTSCDAEKLLSDVHSKEDLIYADPPYFEKGNTLYLNSYKPADHARLASILKSHENPWVLTYDNVDGIRELYTGEKCYEISISYSAQNKRRGSELVILHPSLSAPHALACHV